MINSFDPDKSYNRLFYLSDKYPLEFTGLNINYLPKKNNKRVNY